MQPLSLGLIEVKGLTKALSAADFMLKTSSVKLIRCEENGDKLIMLVIEGKAGAVNASLEAVCDHLKRMGGTFASFVITNPEINIYNFIMGRKING